MRVALLAALIFVAADVPLRAAAPAAQTGTFTAKFTNRSPLSASNELSKRFGEKQAVPDYDLSRHEFIVHVPRNYDATSPIGIMFLLLYKDTSEPPTPCLRLLEEKRLIFIVPKKHDVMPPAVRCGIVLDALHNLKQRYAIDEKRIFLFTTYANDFTNQRFALSCGDVFSGLFISEPAFYKQLPVKGAAKSFYPPRFAAAPSEVLGKARVRPLILAKENPDDYFAAVVKGFQNDGFKRVKTLQANHESMHYPHLDPTFIAEALDFLESAPSTPASPATAAGKNK